MAQAVASSTQSLGTLIGSIVEAGVTTTVTKKTEAPVSQPIRFCTDSVNMLKVYCPYWLIHLYKPKGRPLSGPASGLLFKKSSKC